MYLHNYDSFILFCSLQLLKQQHAAVWFRRGFCLQVNDEEHVEIIYLLNEVVMFTNRLTLATSKIFGYHGERKYT